MKNKGTFLAAFLLLAGIASSNAQDIDKNKVPAAVKSAFMKAYPKATDVDWEMKGSNYEADFDLAKVDYKATYTSAGKAISFEKDIPNSQLPALIVKNIKAKYPQGRIDDVDLINTGGKISYKVDIEGTPDVNVWYTADGKFVKELAD
ncbi:PepSY-like domain-containing protein [Pedobacter endophyticus]|uniref:PepSY-like domain-containing protein n=1 Tax=Pedobacter endophyticus TaxID=2789740 RepID=A0A7S9L1C4_9SPHI|nr:PepSY-like domain-containing protein [Pedobacter endophyticus]QPH40662.1 PepSY-like domain-containing protein [Pedobacter endophyticus]